MLTVWEYSGILPGNQSWNAEIAGILGSLKRLAVSAPVNRWIKASFSCLPARLQELSRDCCIDTSAGIRQCGQSSGMADRASGKSDRHDPGIPRPFRLILNRGEAQEILSLAKTRKKSSAPEEIHSRDFSCSLSARQWRTS